MKTDVLTQFDDVDRALGDGDVVLALKRWGMLFEHSGSIVELIRAAQAVSCATHSWNAAIRKVIACEPCTGIDLLRLDEALAKFLPAPTLTGKNPDFVIVDEIGLPTQ